MDVPSAEDTLPGDLALGRELPARANDRGYC